MVRRRPPRRDVDEVDGHEFQRKKKERKKMNFFFSFFLFFFQSFARCFESRKSDAGSRRVDKLFSNTSNCFLAAGADRSREPMVSARGRKKKRERESKLVVDELRQSFFFVLWTADKKKRRNNFTTNSSFAFSFFHFSVSAFRPKRKKLGKCGCHSKAGRRRKTLW